MDIISEGKKKFLLSECENDALDKEEDTGESFLYIKYRIRNIRLILESFKM